MNVILNFYMKSLSEIDYLTQYQTMAKIKMFLSPTTVINCFVNKC